MGVSLVGVRVPIEQLLRYILLPWWAVTGAFTRITISTTCLPSTAGNCLGGGALFRNADFAHGGRYDSSLFLRNADALVIV